MTKILLAVWKKQKKICYEKLEKCRLWGTLPTEIFWMIYQNLAKSEVSVYCVCRWAVLKEYLCIARGKHRNAPDWVWGQKTIYGVFVHILDCNFKYLIIKMSTYD